MCHLFFALCFPSVSTLNPTHDLHKTLHSVSVQVSNKLYTLFST